MDFNSQDLQLLYGSFFYWLEAKEPEFNENAIVWKNKAHGKITLILDEPEFRDRKLTEFLKNIVAAIGIPFDTVNFGVIVQPFTLENFQSMHTKHAIVFGLDYLSGAENPIAYQEKIIYKVPKLSYMIDNQEQKRTAWNILKNLKTYYLEKR